MREQEAAKEKRLEATAVSTQDEGKRMRARPAVEAD